MPKILVVDDDGQVRNMLKMYFEEYNYQVLVASDGLEALAHVREEQPDLIITDLVMPDKEGMETIIELRKDYPDVKIIAISGGGRVGPDSYLHLAKKLGADRTFAKPLRHDDLRAAVEELLS